MANVRVVTGADARADWVAAAAGSGFDVDHLPYGVVAGPEGPYVGVRVGDRVVDLAAAARVHRPGAVGLFAADALNPLMASGPEEWTATRAWVTTLLAVPEALTTHAVDEVTLRLPFAVADYVDFYASEHHATRVGRLFRPDAEPLLPNWKHLPVGYHGRAGTVVVSGTAVRRPCGQRKDAGEPAPSYGPSRRLDLEAELGFVVGRASELGSPVPAGELDASVFGVVGLNDWSARDLQAWEYVPLGPHLGKSFATSISAWVTPLAALERAWVAPPPRDEPLLPYLAEGDAPGGRPGGLDVTVEVEVDGEVVARTPYAAMYWTPAQLLAHLTVNGASVRVGDLLGSGTISGPAPGACGCLLELYGGTRFLDDGAQVVLRYSAPSPRGRLTLGEVAGTVLPATPR